MIRFIEKPNLPQEKVHTVICGELCSELNSFLDFRAIERIVIKPNVHIDPATSGHADMAAIHLGKNTVFADKNQSELIDRLKKKDFTVIESASEIKGEYPRDVALNLTVMGNRALGNFAFADALLAEKLCGFEHLNVRQGYCKCSCLVIDENALITDDNSIYNIACKKGIDCLLVSKGDVSLPGHEYGFIGGASGKISKNEVLFFGDITKHRDYKEIAGFIKNHGCEILSLDFPLTDFGGIIPITEKAP